MILSNDGLVAFHYRSYGTFFLQQNRLHNIHRGFTHYKYYRAEILKTDESFDSSVFWELREMHSKRVITRYIEKSPD